MAFFRIKNIKGKEYVYIVESNWKDNSSRQKVKSYIGRVYRFTIKNDVDFLQFMKIKNIEAYINKNHRNKIMNDLIEWEIFKFGIDKDEFPLDLDNCKILKNNRNGAILVNDGYMCNLTLKNLLEFKPEGDEETDGYRFARAFVEAGIKIPQDVFVRLFEKLYKTKEEIKDNG